MYYNIIKGAPVVKRVIAMLLLSAISAGAATRHVALSGSHTYPYTNWATAATSLWECVISCVDDDIILVTNGTYRGVSDYVHGQKGTVSNDLTIIGCGTNVVFDGQGVDGFLCPNLGTKAIKSSWQNFEIRSCTGPYAAVVFDGDTRGTVISNVIWRACSNDNVIYGGAVMIYSTTIADKDITFIDCDFIGNIGRKCSAVDICNRDGVTTNVRFIGCTFTSNSASYSNSDGGVLHSSRTADDSYIVSNCTFVNNYSYKNGCVINASIFNSTFVSNDSLGEYPAYGGAAVNCRVFNSRFVHNRSFFGGAIYNSYARNCLFFGNSAPIGGAASESRLDSCTLVGNYLLDGYTASWIGSGAIKSSLTNCVVFYNSTNKPTLDGCKLTNSCSQEPYAGAITNNPLFLDASHYATFNLMASNFVLGANGINGMSLTVGSPCIDKGTNQAWMVGALDLSGNARIYADIVDMGAYEYLPVATAVPENYISRALLLWMEGL